MDYHVIYAKLLFILIPIKNFKKIFEKSDCEKIYWLKIQKAIISNSVNCELEQNRMYIYIFRPPREAVTFCLNKPFEIKCTFVTDRSCFGLPLTTGYGGWSPAFRRPQQTTEVVLFDRKRGQFCSKLKRKWKSEKELKSMAQFLS